MSVLVDSSVWVAYFRDKDVRFPIDFLIEEDLIFTNDLILAEIVPALLLKRQRTLVSLLKDLPRNPLRIDWNSVVKMQLTCLRNGVNKIGIPDLVIAQHAIQYELTILTFDKHFMLLSKHVPIRLY